MQVNSPLEKHYLASSTWKLGPRCLSPFVKYSTCGSRHSSSLQQKKSKLGISRWITSQISSQCLRKLKGTLLQHLIGGTKASMSKDAGTTIKQPFPPIC